MIPGMPILIGLGYNFLINKHEKSTLNLPVVYSHKSAGAKGIQCIALEGGIYIEHLFGATNESAVC